MVSIGRGVVGLVVALAGSVVAAGVDVRSIEERLAATVADAREDAGRGAVERRPALDETARARARRIAALPHSRRLALGEPVRDELDRSGPGTFRRAAEHLDMNRGYADPAVGFVRSWKRVEGTWRTALDPAWDGMGLGVALADDGWIVLVAIFVEDPAPPRAWGDLEREALDAVNEERRERGLAPLAPHAGLAAVARRHSDDMLRRGYFDHRSPEGLTMTDRVRAAGIGYRRLAENIHRSLGVDDPVATAVENWLRSPGHRRAMLDDRVAETGLGVAIDDEGRVVFTQLFMLADETAGDRAR